MKLLNLLLCLTSLGLLSCAGDNKTTIASSLKPIYIDVAAQSTTLDIANKVNPEWDAIVLQTSDDCLISYIDNIIYENDKYYILDKNAATIYIFEHNGKFVAKLDKKGLGPEEYLGVNAFCVAENNIWIVDGQSENLLCYNENLEEIDRVDIGIAAKDIVYIKGNIYVTTNRSGYEDINYQLCEYNIQNKALVSFLPLPAKDPSHISIVKSKQLALNADSCLFIYSYSDTIFQIKDNEVKPKYKLMFSDRYEDIPLTYEELMEPSSIIRGLLDISRTSKSVLVRYLDNNSLRIVVLDEQSGTSKMYSDVMHSDLGNLNIGFYFFTPKQELIGIYEPETFLEYYDQIIDDDKFKKESDKQKIKQLVKSLKIDNNPILFKFKLNGQAL